jgi:hypothetical protein
VPPSGGFGAQRPYETSVPASVEPSPGLATGITPASPDKHDHPSDFAGAATTSSPNIKGEL